MRDRTRERDTTPPDRSPIALATSWNDSKRGSKKKVVALSVAVAASLAFASPAMRAPMTDAMHKMVSVIVREVPGGSDAEGLVEDLGGHVTRRLDIIEGFAATVPEQALARLADSPEVFSVTADARVRFMSGSGPGSYITDPGSLPFTSKTVGANKYHSAGYTGAGVDVAILDTGIAPFGGFTGDKVVNGADLSFDSQVDELRYLDAYGHGTHLAGIIAGNFSPNFQAFADAQKVEREAFEADQAADKLAFEADQAADKLAFEDQFKTDEAAFIAQYEADKLACEALVDPDKSTCLQTNEDRKTAFYTQEDAEKPAFEDQQSADKLAFQAEQQREKDAFEAEQETEEAALNIEGDLRGIAPGARLVNVKVGDYEGATDVSQVIAGIDWVIQHRNDGDLNIRVLNLSFGTDGVQDYQLDPLTYAAEAAWRKGIVVVAAAGNAGFGSPQLNNPAYDPFVIAVGADDPMGTIMPSDDIVPSWSSRGTPERRPDVVAPGKSVISLRTPASFVDDGYPQGRYGLDYFRGSGTSQSAAVVSGAAALIIGQRPTITPDQVKALLTSTAMDLPQGDPVAQGEGLIDLKAAYKAPTPTAVQIYPLATGLGSLDAARGSERLMDESGVQLSGEQDIFGTPWDGKSWADALWTGKSWAAGSWMGVEWTGDVWTTGGWAGKSWAGKSWAGKSWAGKSWADLYWAGKSWAGKSWAGESWAGKSWAGKSWAGKSWTGKSWAGVSWG